MSDLSTHDLSCNNNHATKLFYFSTKGKNETCQPGSNTAIPAASFLRTGFTHPPVLGS